MSVTQDIFKMQLPLGRFNTMELGTPGLVRIHNKNRKIAFTLPVTLELVRLFRRGQSSIHVRGQWDDVSTDVNLGPVIEGLKW